MTNGAEFESLTPEEVLASLPEYDQWKKQYDAEERAYAALCKAQGRKFDPFKDSQYSKPLIPFGPYFIHLSQINGGVDTAKGAYFFYKTLLDVPEGYSYHGRIQATSVSDYAHLGAIVVGEPETRDGFGNPMRGYVSIAVQKSALRR